VLLPLLLLLLQVNSEDYDGWLPLHVACYYGAATVADMMLRRGAQVRRQQQRHWRSCGWQQQHQWL
jgi:ankyrin repeat protein